GGGARSAAERSGLASHVLDGWFATIIPGLYEVSWPHVVEYTCLPSLIAWRPKLWPSVLTTRTRTEWLGSRPRHHIHASVQRAGRFWCRSCHSASMSGTR